MAETVMIEGKPYLKRNPLGVLGLTFITLGIYGLYWYYKINDEIRTFTKDDSISPVRSLMAVLFGWIIIVPPFIAVWNTANHVMKMEEQVGVQNQISPALAVVLLLVIAIALGIYVQEHLNRVWDKTSGQQARVAPPMPPPTPAVPPG
jgi:uncharacterized membrane protein YidH (DUF202 family)